jgi:hypothetical protein
VLITVHSSIFFKVSFAPFFQSSFSQISKEDGFVKSAKNCHSRFRGNDEKGNSVTFYENIKEGFVPKYFHRPNSSIELTEVSG